MLRMEIIDIFVDMVGYVWYSLFTMVEKRYYLNDILQVLGISKNTYHNWEKSKKVPRAKRDPMNNYRYWTGSDIKELKKITGRK